MPRIAELTRRGGEDPERGLFRTKEWPFALASVALRRQFCLGTYTRCEFFRRKEAGRAPVDSPVSTPRRPVR